MAKVRIYELAKELNVSPKDLLDLLGTIGVANKVPSSSIEDTAARSLRQMIANRNAPQGATAVADAPSEEKNASPTTFANFRAGGARRFSAAREDTARRAVENARGESQAANNDGGLGAGADNPASTVRDFRDQPAGANGANGAANGAPKPGGPPPAPGSAPAPNRPQGGRFARDNRGRGGRDFRRGGGARDRNADVPRFGDRDFRAESGRPAALSPYAEKQVLSLPPVVTVAELADMVGQPVNTLVKRLFMMNIMRSANQAIESDVAGQLVAPFGFSVELQKPRQEQAIEEELEGGTMVGVPPVVTIMGHVDHGKTSLLDIIRSANVQSGEAGGITQRIGAYEVEHNGENIVFLDTPGHEAFTRMRARGAHVTDIAVLVVAADDGVMPQTREAIDHARAAKVPIIVAMNKMDRAEADPDRVKGELAKVDLIPEDYGGDTIVIPVSARTGQGVQDLLDMIQLVAELQDLKANATGLAVGTVIEAQQNTQRGPVATVLVHRGVLRVGDYIVVGNVFGRVRAMLDYKGDNVFEAGPKKPVSIIGLSQVPAASDTLRAVGSAKEAREIAESAAEEAQEGRHLGMGRTLEDLYAKAAGSTKELNVIVKADVQGSVEAMVGSLEKLANEEVRVRIVTRSAGNVTENDVLLASATDAFIIAFSVGVEGSAASLADREGVEIREYSVIYDALNDIKAALEGMLTPVFEERLLGECEVRALFKSTRAGTIAGCYVIAGKIVSGSVLRLYRRGRKVYEGKIDSLKHLKADVKEMVGGQECGVSANKFDNFEEGDVIQSIDMVPIKRSIDQARPERGVVPPPAVTAAARR